MRPLLWLALPLAAAEVNGRVKDPSGAAVGGARVTLTRADTTATATVETEPDGRFRMAGIPAGSYAITVSGTAFAPLRAAIRLTAGQTLDLPLGLTIREVNAEVTVTADVPQRVNVITRDEIAARRQ